MNKAEGNAKKIAEKCTALGISDFGFADVSDFEYCRQLQLPYAVSILIKLSDAVVDEIDGEPTFAYFQHYRSVNALLDSFALQIGLLIETLGSRYFPIAASQSIPTLSPYQGLVSHKAAARLAGLGSIGKSALFLSHRFGPRVRLATILTDLPLPVKKQRQNQDVCRACTRCVNACPAMALKGKVWQDGMPRSEIIDAQACSEYMKQHFAGIGRGAVCGICMRVCQFKGNHSED